MGVLKDGIDEAKESRARLTFAPAGQSTQLMVGATDATDLDILGKAVALYQQFRLRRVYYTAYSPIPHASLSLPTRPPPLVREHRLYQADWLVRHYGYDVSELTTPQAPDLDLHRDPKLAWALRNRERFPVDLNRASREELLRVPGLGVRSVEKLLAARRFRRITLSDLPKVGASLKKSKFFVHGHDPNPFLKLVDSLQLESHLGPEPQQMSLFEARSGEL